MPVVGNTGITDLPKDGTESARSRVCAQVQRHFQSGGDAICFCARPPESLMPFCREFSTCKLKLDLALLGVHKDLGESILLCLKSYLYDLQLLLVYNDRKLQSGQIFQIFES